jgi:molybdopterin molybdotransferase
MKNMSAGQGCDAPGLMPIEQAQQIILETTKQITESEHCLLNDALDRVIAQDIISPINVPAYDNSAMDGYALIYDDLQNTDTLKQVGKSFAGNKYEGHLHSGQCIRIMTGAEIPHGADTVVMQENTQVNGEQVTFAHRISKGSAIRPAGDDINVGAVVLSKGRRITAIDIGLLASLGINEVPVLRKLKVAIFSTGDELLLPGEAPRNDRIFDSNTAMLTAMLSRLGANVLNLGIICDDKAKIRAAFEQANKLADCVITSGGVSVGEADYTREILNEYGNIDFWKLAIKPGKPLAFGRLPNSIFFGLPGNPVSAAVTFDQIAKPALAHMAGENVQQPVLLNAIATCVFNKRPGRTDYQRAFYYVNDKPELCVNTAGSQSSGVLSCFSTSNCYAVLENERGRVEEGETIKILLFDRCIA